ncbi:acetyl/propionyl/methylcrotonyl-CoA carboxylase subunit alpha [Endozoicomonas acroporae]|uniref:acetyl/propionyl/methylcrotonyl-CoA carboxylase subunit alpha n=1 Tax=Endozoicomonas acroporae TaxID=1701104 RepID=UPI0013D351C6|nr:biotin carboxylase N-terminal domain-containing protein [Endozoicomonas acroporae]
MIKRLLIANRGEIACRIIKTAHAMGMETIALYSDADHRALHTTMATKAVYAGPSPALESYLDIEKILSTAEQEKADAIHPGYGFLSENADFALACQQKGIIFVGPPASAIDAMGSKSEAKKIMAEAGVPLVPGYHGEHQSNQQLMAEAAHIGYPLLIKAAFGGGGKGMRVVEHSEHLEHQLESARREAEKAFGNDQLLLERFVTKARHVEVQIFFDQQGNGVFLFDRDCSLQRRHQKVIEEAPAPGLTPELREAMGNAAVAAGKAIGYQGAGTVEFLLDGDQFYFMEMNTRLQVEHPVTEMVTDLDLVEWQLTVASGQPLPLDQASLHCHGHAIEARLYAENPRLNFLPTSGRILTLEWPETHGNLRIDTGIQAGDSITAWYDPMMAKIIARGPSRQAAIAQLQTALARYHQAGICDNRDFLVHLLATPAFIDAKLSTDFIDHHPFPALSPEQREQLLAVAAIYQFECGNLARPDELLPTSCGSNFSTESLVQLYLDEQRWLVRVDKQSNRYLLRIGDKSLTVTANVNHKTCGAFLSLRFDTTDAEKLQPIICRIIPQPGELLKVILPEISHEVALPGHPMEQEDHQDNVPLAPMSGSITCVMVNEGQSVAQGTPLLMMEAMKMEHCITAKESGTVERILYQAGDQVGAGSPLLTFIEKP